MGISTTATCDDCGSVVDRSRDGNPYGVNISNCLRISCGTDDWNIDIIICPACTEAFVELLRDRCPGGQIDRRARVRMEGFGNLATHTAPYGVAQAAGCDALTRNTPHNERL